MAMEDVRPKNWWGRNWKWFVPAGCLTVLLGFGGFIALVLLSVTRMMKSSDAYRLAIARAKASPAVIQSLGKPLEEGTFVSGSVNVAGPSGHASLACPIHGPNGKGTVYVEATKAAGEWRLDVLVAEVQATGERINLLEGERR
jgi:hypothetical protein